MFDKSVIESQGTPFPEVAGIIVHGINGTFVVPAIALLLLIVSFFTKVGAIKWAVIVFVLAVAQGQIGFLGHEFPLAGALHGLTAMVLFGVAFYAGRRLRTAVRGDVSHRGTGRDGGRCHCSACQGRRSAHEDSARRCGIDLDLRRRVGRRLSWSLRILWLKDVRPRSWACSRRGGGPVGTRRAPNLRRPTGAFLGVTILAALSAWWLWLGRRSGRALNLALLPIEAIFWLGFALPFPWLCGIARAVLLVGRGRRWVT